MNLREYPIKNPHPFPLSPRKKRFGRGEFLWDSPGDSFKNREYNDSSNIILRTNICQII
jgi:hypothetical protein